MVAEGASVLTRAISFTKLSIIEVLFSMIPARKKLGWLECLVDRFVLCAEVV